MTCSVFWSDISIKFCNVLTTCFCYPISRGCFYVLNNTKFYVDKIGNKITFWCWEDIGMAFLNLNSLVKLELFGGSVTPDHVDTPASGPQAASRLPADEENLGRSRNQQFGEDGFISLWDLSSKACTLAGVNLPLRF